MPHISCFLVLHCFLIDSFYYSLWISDSSPLPLGPRHCPFQLSSPVPPQHFLSCPTGQTEHFSFFISIYLSSNYHIFTSTCATLYSFCSATFCFLISPIPCLLAASTLHIAQLLLTQETLAFVLLGLCPLIVASSIFY